MYHTYTNTEYVIITKFIHCCITFEAQKQTVVGCLLLLGAQFIINQRKHTILGLPKLQSKVNNKIAK